MSNYLPAKEIVCKVRCSNAMHRIVLSPSGKLSFPDHSKRFVTEKVLMEITKRPYESCRCYEVLISWRNDDFQKIPKELRDARKKSRQFHHERQFIKNNYDPLKTKIGTRIRDRILNALKTARKEVPHLNFMNFTVGPKRVMPNNRVEQLSPSYLCVHVDFGWYKNVYVKGLSVLDNTFVLAAETPLSDGSIPVIVIPFFYKESPHPITSVSAIAVPIKGLSSELKMQYKIIISEKTKSSLINKKITAKVRCGSSMHRVVLMPSGALSFPDHKHSHGPNSRCGGILGAWRRKDYKNIPSALRVARVEAQQLSLSRRSSSPIDGYDPLLLPIENRIADRIAAMAEKLLQKVYPKHNVNVKFGFFETRLYNGHYYFYLYIDQECQEWYKTIYRRGIAVVNNNFILSASEPLPCGSIPVKTIFINPRLGRLQEQSGFLVQDQTSTYGFRFVQKLPDHSCAA